MKTLENGMPLMMSHCPECGSINLSNLGPQQTQRVKCKEPECSFETSDKNDLEVRIS